MASQRVGVIGGGQLAWMMAKEAQTLGIKLIVQTPHADDPAVSLAHDVILAPIDDAQATAQLATRCDVITFENEFIDLQALQPLAATGINFRPSLDTLAPILDKYHQRSYLKKIGLPVPRFMAIDSDNSSVFETLNANGFTFPLVVKSRRHGYDGYGTFIIHNQQQFNQLWQRLENPCLMVEEYVPFEMELGVIIARNLRGEIRIYPVVETQQENQVCHRVMIPAPISPQISLQVEEIAQHLLEELQAVGVFGLELFLTPDGQVLVNEIAPRTHNSGHYTLDACFTSQFAVQLQAVTDSPLGSAGLKFSGAAMVNLLGYEHSHQDYPEKRDKLAAIPHSYLHWYGKTESRPGRKLGHVTLVTDKSWAEESPEKAYQKLWHSIKQIEEIWYDH
ncbi:5-(carboxyamino)imidazole ribonucleotide synthase [Gloeothece citriformis]|nr:5-(carboxyamino)imidazole ribonucleotide synthase [Gloeothece citriformis]